MNNRKQHEGNLKRVILASSSPSRRKILNSSGIKFSAKAPDVDEDSLKKKFKGVKPTDYQSKMKQKQFLFNRGFSSQIIEQIL